MHFERKPFKTIRKNQSAKTVITTDEKQDEKGKSGCCAPTHGALSCFLRQKVLTWSWVLLRQASRSGSQAAIPWTLLPGRQTALQAEKSVLRDVSWLFHQRVCGPFVPARLCRTSTLFLRPSCPSCPVLQSLRPGETSCTFVSVRLSGVSYPLFLCFSVPFQTLLFVFLS